MGRFLTFLLQHPATWTLISLLLSESDTFSNEQFTEFINKLSIFSPWSFLLTYTFTLLLIYILAFNKHFIFNIFSDNVASLSLTKNRPPLISWYWPDPLYKGLLWNHAWYNSVFRCRCSQAGHCKLFTVWNGFLLPVLDPICHCLQQKDGFWCSVTSAVPK